MVKEVVMEDAVVTVDHFTVGEEEVLVHMGVLIHMVDPNLGAVAQKKFEKRHWKRAASYGFDEQVRCLHKLQGL